MFHDKTRHLLCVEVLRVLREERERRGLSKYRVAANCGVAQQTIGYVERGLKSPSFETVMRIAEGMGLDLAQIISQARARVAKRKGSEARK